MLFRASVSIGKGIQMDPLLWQELLQETDIARVAVLCDLVGLCDLEILDLRASGLAGSIEVA